MPERELPLTPAPLATLPPNTTPQEEGPDEEAGHGLEPPVPVTTSEPRPQTPQGE